jgi:hypothetical protein
MLHCCNFDKFLEKHKKMKYRFSTSVIAIGFQCLTWLTCNSSVLHTVSKKYSNSFWGKHICYFNCKRSEYFFCFNEIICFDDKICKVSNDICYGIDMLKLFDNSAFFCGKIHIFCLIWSSKTPFMLVLLLCFPKVYICWKNKKSKLKCMFSKRKLIVILNYKPRVFIFKWFTSPVL